MNILLATHDASVTKMGMIILLLLVACYLVFRCIGNIRTLNTARKLLKEERDAKYAERQFYIDPDTDDGKRFLEGIAANIIDNKQPSMTVNIYTKYYPPTRLDPPEWDDKDVDVDYGDLPDSVQDDLQERLVEALAETLDEQTFESEKACEQYILNHFTNTDWDYVMNAWSDSNNDCVQEKAQEDYDNQEPDYED